MTCKDCIHFGICKKGFPWADGKGGGWCDRFKDKSRIVELPCKVGDKVYELKENGKIVRGIVESIHQNLVGNEQGRWIVTSWFDDYYANSKEAGFECGTHLYSAFEDFGKTVFLTREQAEEALRKEREK